MPGTTLEVPAVLAATLGGVRRLDVANDGGATVGDILDAVAADHPVFGRRVRDETGAVRRYVNVYLGQENIRDLHGLATEVPAGARIMIIQSVAGG
jgi:molybdopterin converting factor small subunit